MRAKKATRQELEQALVDADNRAHRLSMALADALDGKLAIVQDDSATGGLKSTVLAARGEDPGEWHFYRLARPTGAQGGLVIVLFRYPGQRASVHVESLDELARRASDSSMNTAQRVAIERLLVARQRAFDAEEAQCATAGTRLA